ncbi:MAG: lysylphosphatidylglycerol synthase transmembrane domain-containing protein, partial [Acidimicrobiales bacterium]
VARRVPRVNPDRVSSILVRLAERITLLIANRRKLWWALIWATLNWLLDAACLWVFLWAFGSVLSPVDLLVAYGLANVLAVIPVTPAGLGVVEGVLIATVVGFGVPHGQAILAVLAYRLINFWLPIPVGGLAYLSLHWRTDRHPTPPSTTGPSPASDA